MISDGPRYLHFEISASTMSRPSGHTLSDEIDVRVVARLPGLSARFVQLMYIWEFREIYDKLAALQRDMTGGASFGTMERNIEIAIVMDRVGHLKWSVELMPSIGPQVGRLSFDIENDQSYLPEILRQFEAFFDLYL